MSENLVGFVMDGKRLKKPPGKGQQDCFGELLERIRDIRSSERRFPGRQTCIHRLLQFLNEEIFRGAITEKLYETNSKRESD